MPRLEPKQVQRELEQGLIWPVYWIYGPEGMKSQEILKRIKKAVLGGDGLGFSEETLDGQEVDVGRILESISSLTLGGGIRLVVVRDAHGVKGLDQLDDVFGPVTRKDGLNFVCVFLSRDLDGRKKFSKRLLERAAVVPCEEVAEVDREAWIQYLAKRRGMHLDQRLMLQLTTLDPWSLGIVDQELEKYSIASIGEDVSPQGVLLDGNPLQGGSERFLEAFFTRNLGICLQMAEEFSGRPDISLPLLGLISWNLRQLATGGSRNLNRWAKYWDSKGLTRLQNRLAEVDLALKQTPLLPLGVWDSLAIEFCRF